ncbi:hypothetical protein CU669_02615 [Paramagnetospirillum kuznetsovii]|uniref:Uncharacterized protein n=1 Tax=Paramagnetospirillum kuznetsovii TaxID=2053833 RepID=A0A364P3Q7_9PROT|nr:hypothetical protein [Paramagnetospirillum kuznetsovii]RAU23978.1 hypothetical protein CU669_02615 [Paramagnetospirillum kuznetsovii]
MDSGGKSDSKKGNFMARNLPDGSTWAPVDGEALQQLIKDTIESGLVRSTPPNKGYSFEEACEVFVAEPKKAIDIVTIVPEVSG